MKDFVKILSEISSKKQKTETLRQLVMEDNRIAFLFKNALDPFIRFGFKKIPEYVSAEAQNASWDDAVHVIEQLSRMNHSNASETILKAFLTQCPKDFAPTMEKVILKDMKCGVAEATFNDAIHNTELEEAYHVNTYPCMLVASDFKKISKKFNWEEGIFSQEKCDGMRFNAVVDDDRVMYFGRSGKPIEILSKEFSQNFLDLKNSYGKSCVFDGELLVVRDGKILDRKTGNGILNRAVRGTISPEESEQIHATIWDILPYDVFTSDFKKNPSKAYNERFEKLSHLLNDSNSTKVHLVDSKKVFSEEEAMEDFKQKLSEGKEGTILKNPSNIWKDTRVTDCVKLKAELDCDLKVVGIAEGTGKYEGKLGAILCESSDGMLKVSVGTGFTDDDRDCLIKENLVGKIVSVLYNAKICDKKTGVNSLFLPRFIEFREDKTEADSFDNIKG